MLSDLQAYPRGVYVFLRNAAMGKHCFVTVLLLVPLYGGHNGDSEMVTSGSAPAAGLSESGGVSPGAASFSSMNGPLPHDMVTGEKVYRSTCNICNRLGLRGAPRLGDREDWVMRFAQGNEILYERAVYGYRGSKGSMPSRGSNAKLSEDDVRAAVDYMVWYSVPRPQNPNGSRFLPATTKHFTIH